MPQREELIALQLATGQPAMNLGMFACNPAIMPSKPLHEAIKTPQIVLCDQTEF